MTRKTEAMPDDVRNRLWGIRLKSKFGTVITREEQAFCERAWKKWPDEYGKMDEEIRGEATRRMNPLAR
jgi:hypothetical protein